MHATPQGPRRRATLAPAQRQFTLIVQPGWDDEGDHSLGYPYGSIPRLLLTYITTKAKLQHSQGEDPRLIELGPSLDGFMREIGLNPDNGTGVRSDARRLRAQADRLFQAKISFFRRSQRADGAHGKSWQNMSVTEGGELWWDPKRPGQATLWGSRVYRGERFSQALVAAPVSLDLRGVRAVKRSPLEFDLYTWAVHKAFITNRKGAPQSVPWEGLYWQFGTEYGRPRDFKRKATAALEKIKHLFPGGGLRIEYMRTSLLEDVGGVQYDGAFPWVVADGDRATSLTGTLVSGEFFQVLGARPAPGRLLEASDAATGVEPVVVISYTPWKGRFGGDPSVLGRRLGVNGELRTVVGVAPHDFEYPSGVELWLPVAPIIMADGSELEPFSLLVRLRPG